MKTTNILSLHLAALNCYAVAQVPPLITKRWSADPSAHVFEDRLFIYGSHDYNSGTPPNSEGDHFAMKDYYFYSMDTIYGSEEVTDHGLALTVEDVPWASRQLWAPDAAYKDGTYYLYFPARDEDDIWRIGVATSSTPEGPFEADESWIPDTYSIDPSAFTDVDGSTYLQWGGLHGGQLQCWQNKTKFDDSWSGQKEPPAGQPALAPQIARLSEDMRTLAEKPVDIVILAPETGRPIQSEDKDRRFFEGSWIHERNGTYYMNYSTGTTHYLVYATADNPYGPYTYQGRLLEPVSGWTTHGSITEYDGQWWLFYHDSEASGGVDWLRQVKAKKIWYDAEGLIVFSPPQ